MEELAIKLSNWIESKVTSAKAKGAVIGLSGGIDSAVVAVLCKKVFSLNTLTLIMPCHSLNKDIEDAVMVANKFDITYKIIDLSRIYDSFVSLLDHEEDGVNSKLAKANLKPRMRMITLYYFANQLNYLVVGTGNKSEITMGYFTKYGDGGVDILPLGNLLKSEVVELAKYLKIPLEIIQKPPSGGLWEGQTDEGEMGVSYQEIDEYLKAGRLNDRAIEKKIQEMITRSAHKRSTPEIPTF